VRHVKRGSRRRFIGGRGDALIERHHDVGADRLLRLDADFRAKQDRFSVEITLENRALLAHRARMRQRENLKPTGVRQNRALPTHETVNAAGAAKNFRAGTQQQMVRIHQQDLGASILERLRELRFYRGLRSHRHEERSPHLAVQSAKGRGPGAGARHPRLEAEIQARRHYGMTCR
jgi:hypothetical protein